MSEASSASFGAAGKMADDASLIRPTPLARNSSGEGEGVRGHAGQGGPGGGGEVGAAEVEEVGRACIQSGGEAGGEGGGGGGVEPAGRGGLDGAGGEEAVSERGLVGGAQG